MREGKRERGNVEYERIEEERVWALQGAFQGALRGSRGREPGQTAVSERLCSPRLSARILAHVKNSQCAED